jgi:hypothetical protein
MSKRLINFRGTNDFARVEVRKGAKAKPKTGGGIQWASCMTSVKQVFEAGKANLDTPQTPKEEEPIFSIKTKYGIISNQFIETRFFEFDRPCLPSNHEAVKNGFVEPDFNEFQRQYFEAMQRQRPRKGL